MIRIPKLLIVYILFLSLAACGGGGGGGSDAPSGMVTLSAEEIAGPGGRIVYQGQEYDEAVDVPEDALLGVVKEGRPYLYHPAMGNAEWSEQTSREAVARFMIGENAGSPAPSAAVPEAIPMYAAAEVEDIDDETDLPTRIHISRNQNQLTISNRANRWAAIKITSGGNEQIYFISPRARLFDSNFLRWIKSLQQNPTFEDLLEDEGMLDRFISSGSFTITVSPPATVETFGAVFRALPLYSASMNWAPGSQEGWKADHALVLCVNTIDLYYVVMEGLKHLLQLVPFSCLDALTGELVNWVEMEFLGYMTREERIASDWYRILEQDYANAMFQCAALVPTKASSELASTFWNILTAGDYLLEDVVLVDTVFTNAACYSISDMTEDLAASFSQAPSTLTIDETGTWAVTVVGGMPPYRAKFNWSDGETREITNAGASITMDRQFTSEGDYAVSVMVIDSDGEARQIETSVKVSGAPPEDLAVAFITAPDTLQPDQNGTWTVSVIDAAFPVTAVFDWGDGKKSTISGSASPVSASHKYAQEGFYSIVVEITDKNGASGQDIAALAVEAETIEDCVDVSGLWTLKIVTVQKCGSDTQTYPPTVVPAYINQIGCDIDMGNNLTGSITGNQVRITAPFAHNDMTKTAVLTGTATQSKMVVQGTLTFVEPWQTCTYEYKYDFYR